MSHAQFEVKWNERRSKWEVLEERSYGGYYVIERYRLKSEAKGHAQSLAKKEKSKAGFYSKDSAGEERRTHTVDYADYKF